MPIPLYPFVPDVSGVNSVDHSLRGGTAELRCLGTQPFSSDLSEDSSSRSSKSPGPELDPSDEL